MACLPWCYRPRSEVESTVEFRILGPLEAREGERVIALGGARQRAVLAILLTHANEVVSADRLIDELWGDSPPGTAANVLQGYVSHLRKALGPGAIATRAPGYAIELEPGQLDLHRFEALVEEGGRALSAQEPEQAAELLHEALGLWRGSALADFAYEPFAQAEIARLEELRLAAQERRIEADLALGRHAELVGELEGLVARHPLRERLRAHLMVALYRAGRQAEALDVYQDARRALVDGLGIDPSPALQELERAILRQDPSLDAQGARPAATPAPEHQPEELEFPERSLLVVPQGESNIDALLTLAEPLAARPPREIILAQLVPEGEPLAEVNELLEARRASLVARRRPARAATFTSASPGEDLVMLASDQEVDLVLLGAPASLLDEGVFDPDLTVILADMPCDVAVLVGHQGQSAGVDADRPVVVPFGGAEHEWAAVEIGAWLAAAHGARLRLLGTTADPESGRRDASRLLARAALMVQRVASVPTEPALVEPGEAAVISAADEAGLIVVGLSPRWRQEGMGSVRLAVLRAAKPPALLVRRGLRPGGLAPRETMTRFTWTLARPDE
jgi:DNA-binding SARP family transcriptional activator